MNAKTILSLTLFTHALVAQAQERVQVPIGNVFVAAHGNSDADSVPIVLDGILPNGCYAIADSPMQINRVTHQIRIQIFAEHRNDGPCADENHLPLSLLIVPSYMVEKTAGNLPLGKYDIAYERPGFGDGHVEFSVEKSSLPSQSDSSAQVTGIDIADSVRGDFTIRARLTGTIGSRCNRDPRFSVDPIGDVFLVKEQAMPLPKGRLCTPLVETFSQSIRLGKPGEGRFLIQVRNPNGKILNKVFSALVPDEG